MPGRRRLSHAGALGILLLVFTLSARSQNVAGTQDPTGSAEAKLRSCEKLRQGAGSEPLVKACEYAVALPRTLPDLVCKETIDRRLTEKGRPDRITAELTVEKTHSHYSAVRVNGRFPEREDRTDDEIFAEEAVSTGEFALLFNVFDAASQTQFAPPVEAVLDHRHLQRYDFRVKRENNLGWTWYFLGFAMNPGYHGSIFLDGKTGEVARLVLEVNAAAGELNPQNPVLEATTTVDYAGVVIGEAGRQHVPVRSQNVSCLRTLGCIHANSVFSDFHKFGAETRIVP